MPAQESETLKKLEGFFRESVQAESWKDFSKNGTKAFRYKEGDQWTAKELADLETRGQPPYVNNQVKVTIDRLTGQFAQAKTRIGFRPRTPEDQRTADLLTDVFRYIYQNNNLEFQERATAEDGFTCGRGVLEVSVDFDDEYQPQITVANVDVWSIHPDPKSRAYDWNVDALYITRDKWIDTDEVVGLFPEKAAAIRALQSADPAQGDLAESDALNQEDIRFIDSERNRIRLVEVEYKVSERETIWIDEQGESEVGTKKDPKLKKRGLQPIHRTNSKMRKGIFTQGILLEDEESEKRRFSYIQYLVHRKKSGEPYSMLYPAFPLQDTINKRGSKALHLLNNNQTLYETQSLVDPVKFAEEKSRPDGMLEVRDGQMDKIKMLISESRALAAEQMAFHDSDLANFRRVTGVNPDALGEKSEIRSGIGIARKVAQTDIVVAGAFDNFRRTRVAMAHTVVDCIQKYYTPRKLELITDNAESPTFIDLDEFSLNAIKQRKYDVVVEEMPSLVNVEEEQFQTLAQMLPSMIQTGPFWMKIMLSLSRLRDKDKILKQLEALPKGPSIQPKLSISAQLDKMSAQERGYLYQQMGAPELADFVVKENRPPAGAMELQMQQMKLQGEQAKIQAEIQKLQMEAQAAQQALQAEQQRAATDQEQVAFEAEIEQNKAQIELAVAEKEAEVAVILARLDIIKAELELEKKQLEIQKAQVEVSKARLGKETSDER